MNSKEILIALSNIEIMLEEISTKLCDFMKIKDEKMAVDQPVIVEEKPHIKFARLWKSDAAFRADLLNKFPALKMAIDNDAKVKITTHQHVKLAKEVSCVWKLCKADKSNNQELVKYVLKVMDEK